MSSNPGHNVPRRIDPSLDTLPSIVARTYAIADSNMAQERRLYGELQAAHLGQSREKILATADAGIDGTPAWKPRKAIILGAGNCADIPVSDLVDMFDQTVFVDVHTEGTERALSGLTLGQQAKVNLVRADVTGMIGRLLSAVEETCRDTDDYQNFTAAANLVFRQYTPNLAQKPPLGRDYAFVCSQLLLSQLCAIPYDYVDSLVAAKFGQRLSVRPGATDRALSEIMAENRLHTQTDHINHLAYLVSNTGSVHFADTYAVSLNTDPGTSHPIIFEDVVQPVIDLDFEEIVPRVEWDGHLIPDRTFQIVANALTPQE